MDRLPDPDARAYALAARQDGLLSLADAEACGITIDRRKRRTGSGRWILVADGVYRMPGSPETWRQRIRAAVMAVAAAGGWASFVSSGALHTLLAPSPLPHVSVPPGCSPRCRLAKVHRSTLWPEDLCTVDGIRTTTVSRMIVDMATVLDRPSLENLVDDALCQGRASIESVLSSLERAGDRPRGGPLLRSVVEVWSDAIEPGSLGEMRLLRRVDEWGFEAPVTQYEIRAPDGTFVARVDAAWPHRKIALEYEGLRYHAARRFDADERRYAAIRALGWRLATADKTDLLPGARRLPDLLAAWFDARRGA